MNRRTTLAVAISALAAAWLPQGPASAHNAAHFFLPDGSCHEVGSNRDAPIVGGGNPNQSPGSNNLPGRRLRVFQDDRVLFHGQPVAVVVATTLEAAQHGASVELSDGDGGRGTRVTVAFPGG